MKKVILSIIFIGLLSLLTSCADNALYHDNADAQSNGPITFQTFYDNLSPHGNWVNYPGYGYAWYPNGSRGFSPYLTNGHWAYTQEGWLWVSNYRWGWAPFHYGSWLYDDYYGWLWLPGYEWAPAWVNWGYCDGYYGWAPITPLILVNGPYNAYRPGYRYWNFVPCGYIGDHNLRRHTASRTQVNRFASNVNIINNYNNTRKNRHYNAGPTAGEVQKRTGRVPQPVVLTDQQTSGPAKQRNGAVEVYRPSVSRRNAATAKPATTPLRENVSPGNAKNRRTDQAPAPKPRTPVTQQKTRTNSKQPTIEKRRNSAKVQPNNNTPKRQRGNNSEDVNNRSRLQKAPMQDNHLNRGKAEKPNTRNNVRKIEHPRYTPTEHGSKPTVVPRASSGQKKPTGRNQRIRQ